MTDEKRIESYRIVDACANCDHVFRREADPESDEAGVSYYCTFGAAPRPVCMSYIMDDGCALDNKGISAWPLSPEYAAAQEAWDAWRSGRGVDCNGICDCWEPASGGVK